MENTQAQAPVTTQAQEPVSEAALHDQFLSFVKDTPDNDPHEGTDLEEQNTPAQKEEQAEQKEEKEEPEHEIEIDEETPVFELEIKKTGEKKKLSLKELREGYLAKEDYHRNIQQVKKQESELHEKAQQAQTLALQQYSQQLETYKQAVVRFVAPELLNVDLNKLAEEDPARAQQLFFKKIQLNEVIQGLAQEQQQTAFKLEGERKKQFAEARTKADEVLGEKIPGWSEEKRSSLFKSVSAEYGIPLTELETIVAPQTIELLHDASEYRSLKKAKPEVQKKVVAVPKVVKPGSGEKPNPSADAENDLERRLKKSGDWRVAAQLYLAQSKRR